MNSKFLGTVFSRCMYAHPVCERTNELCAFPILMSTTRIILIMPSLKLKYESVSPFAKEENVRDERLSTFQGLCADEVHLDMLLSSCDQLDT